MVRGQLGHSSQPDIPLVHFNIESPLDLFSLKRIIYLKKQYTDKYLFFFKSFKQLKNISSNGYVLEEQQRQLIARDGATRKQPTA